MKSMQHDNIDRKKTLLGIIIALIFTAAITWIMPIYMGLFSFVPIRMAISLATQAALFTVAVLANNFIEKQPFSELGFTSKNLPKQLIWAGAVFLMLVAFMSAEAVFMGLPNVIGTQKQPLWYALPQKIIFVGFAEETLFRGYILNAIRRLSSSSAAAIIISSLLFGAWHLINGNLIQAVNTSLIGLIFAIPFAKGKNCSLLSVALAHGLYDALLDVLRWM
jgi:membrane protease YdiL (CAAX protease family)